LLLVAFLLVHALNCHLSLVLASVVEGDAVNCNSMRKRLIYAIWSCEALDCKSTSHPPTKSACVHYWLRGFVLLTL